MSVLSKIELSTKTTIETLSYFMIFDPAKSENNIIIIVDEKKTKKMNIFYKLPNMFINTLFRVSQIVRTCFYKTTCCSTISKSCIAHLYYLNRL